MADDALNAADETLDSFNSGTLEDTDGFLDGLDDEILDAALSGRISAPATAGPGGGSSNASDNGGHEEDDSDDGATPASSVDMAAAAGMLARSAASGQHQKQLAQLRERVEQLTAENAALRRENEAAAAENATLREEARAAKNAEASMADSSAEIAALRLALQTARDEADDARRQFGTARAAVSALQDQAKTIRAQCEARAEEAMKTARDMAARQQAGRDGETVAARSSSPDPALASAPVSLTATPAKLVTVQKSQQISTEDGAEHVPETQSRLSGALTTAADKPKPESPKARKARGCLPEGEGEGATQAAWPSTLTTPVQPQAQLQVNAQDVLSPFERFFADMGFQEKQEPAAVEDQESTATAAGKKTKTNGKEQNDAVRAKESGCSPTHTSSDSGGGGDDGDDDDDDDDDEDEGEDDDSDDDDAENSTGRSRKAKRKKEKKDSKKKKEKYEKGKPKKKKKRKKDKKEKKKQEQVAESAQSGEGVNGKSEFAQQWEQAKQNGNGSTVRVCDYHLGLERQTFMRPTYCSVCQKMLMGVFNQGFACMHCNQFYVHEECRNALCTPKESSCRIGGPCPIVAADTGPPVQF
eukprot:g2215.t1